MADYNGLTSVFETAIPHVWKAKYPDIEWSRRIEVTDAAEDNFVVSKTAILISPKAIGEDLDILQFCVRVCKATLDFDTRKERAALRIRAEFQEQLNTLVSRIVKRYGTKGLSEMMTDAYNSAQLNDMEPAVFDYTALELLPTSFFQEII